MVAGFLLRLALSILFFAVARYALKPDVLKNMLGDLAERFFKPRDAFDKVLEYQPRLVQAAYAFSALFLLFSATFLYHHLRQLKVVADPESQVLPYTTAPRPSLPAAAPPYSGAGAGSLPGASNAIPATPTPYGGQSQAPPSPGTAQPYGGQLAPPYSGRAPGTQQVQPGGQPYGR